MTTTPSPQVPRPGSPAGPAENAPQGRPGVLPRQHAGVLRLLHLRHRGSPGVPPPVLPLRGPGHRADRRLRHLRRRVRGAACWRTGDGALRRQAGPQEDPAADPRHHGPGVPRHRLPAHLRTARRLGPHPAGGGPAGAGLLRRRGIGGRLHADAGTLTRRQARVLHQLRDDRATPPAWCWPPWSSSRLRHCPGRP